MDVEIVEVSPRDGLQNEQRVLPTETKLELVRRSVSAGLRRVEAVSFARPDRVPQMADAEAVMAGVPRDRGVRYMRPGAEPARLGPGAGRRSATRYYVRARRPRPSVSATRACR